VDYFYLLPVEQTSKTRLRYHFESRCSDLIILSTTLSGTASGQQLNLNYLGMVVLNAANANPAVNYQNPPAFNTNLPSDTSLLPLIPMNSMRNAPDLEYYMNLVIIFHEDEMGVNRPYINRDGYNYSSNEYKMGLNKIPLLRRK
jgi:hypothetical protein